MGLDAEQRRYPGPWTHEAVSHTVCAIAAKSFRAELDKLNDSTRFRDLLA